MSPGGDLELGGEEEYPVAGTVRYFYSREEYQALEREKQDLEERLRQAQADLRRRSLWGRLWALLPGAKQA